MPSRPLSSCRPAPEREGRVVVAVPQPPSARAESAVVFLQKEIRGQQYVVRQIPILRKEHLTTYNKKSKSNSFQSILISWGSVHVAFKHLTPTAASVA
jgi:hypothetical protein